jgi:arsenite methyltransferase
MPDRTTITESVKSRYGAVARGTEDLETNKIPCCGSEDENVKIGYTTDQLAALPDGAALGLGCGNPSAHAAIKPGEVVIDLGSGAGIDCFLAARAVGDRGFVIGIDMTEDMLERARANATKGGYSNVDFRLGEIEEMPVDTGTADLILSNCVINLAPDKTRVFREILRVLKPGGRFCVSDIVSNGPIPSELREDMDQWTCCVAGALERAEYLSIIRDAGFERTVIAEEHKYDYAKSDDFSLSSVTVIGFKQSNQ